MTHFIEPIPVRSDSPGNVCSPTASTIISRPRPVIPAFTTSRNNLCSSQTATYTVSSEGATSYDWEATGGLLVNGSASAYGIGASVSVAAPSSGDLFANLRVRANRGLCGTSDWKTTEIRVGNTTAYGISVTGGTASPGVGNTFTFALSSIPSNQGSITYNWTLPSGWSFTGPVPGNTNRTSVRVMVGSTAGYVRCYFRNDCGVEAISISPYMTPVQGGGGGTPLRVFPNPASDAITVDYSNIDPENSTTKAGRLITDQSHSEKRKALEIKFFDSMGRLVKSVICPNEQRSISTTELQNGIYIVQVSNGNEIQSQRISIRR